MTTTDDNQLSDSELIAAALRHLESGHHRNTCRARYAPCACGYTLRGGLLMQELAKRLETILAQLSDPVAVHLNMLRGSIAKLDVAAIRHLYGDALKEEWRPIETAPRDKTLFLAATADGRMMIWRADLLATAMRQDTPDHLTFPATHWRPLPAPPADAEGR